MENKLPTFQVDIGNATYEVDAVDEKTAWKLANQAHTTQALPPAKPAYTPLTRMNPQVGIRQNNPVEGVLRGMADPFVGAAQLGAHAIGGQTQEDLDRAIRESEQGYEARRREQAGGQEPGFNYGRLAGNIINPANIAAGARLPLALVNTLPKLLATGSVMGGATSALTPLTEEAQQANYGPTKAAQIGVGMVAGPTTQVGGKVLGAVGSNIAQQVNESSASNAAKLKLAELLSKSGVGTMFRPGGGGDPLAQIEAKLATRAPETTLAGVAGQGPKSMLDTLATLPGEAKTLVEQLIRNQQATRGKRLVTAADEALGTSGKTYTGTLDALVNEKKTVSAPFYEQLKDVSVKVDNDLSNLIQASKTAHGGAELLAEIKRTTPIDISKIKAGDDIPFDALDKVKQALYDLAEKSKGEFGKATELSKAYNQLRIDLTNKMDALSPKDKNGSIYKQARDAFAGPSQLEDAVKTGRNAMKEDAIKVADATKGMTASEQEAYRIGVLQSLKDKVGTEGGQTSLLKMWKEPATSDKLKEIFGNDYRKFAADVAREARLKEIETVGRGSQSVQRLYGAGELDNLAPVAQAVQGAASGNPAQTMGAMAKMWNRVSTPEETRNELAKLLLQQGPAAVRTVRELPAMVKQYNEAELKKALLASTLAQQPNR